MNNINEDEFNNIDIGDYLMHQSGSLIQKIIRFHSNGAILEAIAIGMIKFFH